MKIIMNNEYRMVFHLKPFLKMWIFIVLQQQNWGACLCLCYCATWKKISFSYIWWNLTEAHWCSWHVVEQIKSMPEQYLKRANKLRLTLLFSFFISHLYSLLPGELFGISSEEFLSHVQMSQKLLHTEVF